MYSETRSGDCKWRLRVASTRPRIRLHSDFAVAALSRWENVSMQENAMFQSQEYKRRPSVNDSLRLGAARLGGGASRTDPHQRIHACDAGTPLLTC
jgi:hypothetical protein